MITEDLHVLHNFCKGCGTCEGICPQGAIKLQRKENGQYFPYREEALCQKCGLCYASCPAWPFDPDGILYKSIESATADQLIGPFINAYSGFGKDDNLRISGSSGGIATALLIHQLKTGKIDTALVVGLDKNNPFAEPNIILAKTVDEIKAAAGSKYLPVALNTIIKQIIDRNDITQVGIVGLPCHIEGLKKACSINKKLQKKIAFTIGLFCRQTKELGFTCLLLSRLGVEDSQLASFSYRGGGWPGYVSAKLKDGTERKCLFFDQGFMFLWLLQSFTPMPCMLCCDPIAEFADISIGDAWLEEFADDKEGMSLIITRTLKGNRIIEIAETSDILSLQKIEQEKVIESQQKRALMRKKINYRSKLAALKPSDYKKIKKQFSQKLDIRGILALRWIMMARNLSSSRLFAGFFSKIPQAFFDRLKKGAQKRKAIRAKISE